MAFRKYSSADMVTPKVDAKKWVSQTSTSPGRVKTASTVLSKYDPAKWLLSHVTIMASVDLEEAKPGDPKSAYLIKPEHSIFVNNNGDCWERELLAKTYQTFLGADNYVEHIQLPELSKGKVVDVALREVDLGTDSNGKPCTTLYVDLLIATSWDYPDICQKILSGEYNAVSMGCLIQYSTCSRCGHVSKDETDQCEHMQYYRRNTFYDSNGVKRITAEICGHKDDPSSVTFIDASWVRKPAFPGAVLRNIVSPSDTVPPQVLENLEKAAAVASGTDPLMSSVKDRTVLDTRHHKVDGFAKAASEVTAEEGQDTRFGEEPKEDEPKDDTKDEAFPEAPAEAPADAPAEGEDPFGGLGDTPAEGEEKTTPEEAEQTPFEKIKKDINDRVLTQIKQQLMDQVSELVKDPPTTGDEAVKNEAEYNSALLPEQSLVKDASSQETAKYLLNKYSVDISKVRDIKLASTLMALAATEHISDIAKLGFTRKDAVAAINFVDQRRNGEGISPQVLDYVASFGISKKKTGSAKVASKENIIMGYVLKTARKPSEREKKALTSWINLLNGMV